MTTITQPILLALALALGALPALAQPAAGDTAGGSSAPVPDSSTEQAAPTEQAPAAGESTSKSSSSAKGSGSPFDYRSSEEISEDVPVSFPVDI